MPLRWNAAFESFSEGGGDVNSESRGRFRRAGFLGSWICGLLGGKSGEYGRKVGRGSKEEG